MQNALQNGNTSAARKVNKEVGNEREAEFYHLAAAEGNYDILKFLISSCGCASTAKNGAGQTVLHTAVLNAQVETTKYLLSIGLSPDELDNQGNAPVHYAAKEGNLHLVKLLTWTGDYIPKENKEGLPPLAMAVKAGHATIVQYFLAYKNERIGFSEKLKAIQVAVEGDRNQCGVLQQFVRHDQKFINEFLKYQKGRSEYTKTAEVLNGIKLDGSRLDYARMWAIFEYTEELKAYISKHVESGVDIDAKDAKGYTCLQEAAEDGNLSVMKCLVEVANANVNSLTSDDKGYSPLHFAAKSKNEAMAKYLIFMGATNDIRANDRYTTPVRMNSSIANYHLSAFSY